MKLEIEKAMFTIDVILCVRTLRGEHEKWFIATIKYRTERKIDHRNVLDA